MNLRPARIFYDLVELLSVCVHRQHNWFDKTIKHITESRGRVCQAFFKLFSSQTFIAPALNVLKAYWLDCDFSLLWVCNNTWHDLRIFQFWVSLLNNNLYGKMVDYSTVKSIKMLAKYYYIIVMCDPVKNPLLTVQTITKCVRLYLPLPPFFSTTISLRYKFLNSLDSPSHSVLEMPTVYICLSETCVWTEANSA